MPEPGSKRGRVHDAEGAREAILDAAEAVFAEHGFDGARIDAIAALAGYNKSLIFQYYGDKLRLYDAVIRRADQQTRGIQERAVALIDTGHGGLDPAKTEAAFRILLGEFWDYLVAHPRVLRIFMWEMAEGWQTYAKIQNRQDQVDLEIFGPILYGLQAAGVLRGGMDPLFQVILAEFYCMTYLASIPMVRLFLPDRDFTSSEALATAREQVFDLILRGLLVPPGERRGGGHDMS
jgi:TetR/AcrR family transcriptional regulator